MSDSRDVLPSSSTAARFKGLIVEKVLHLFRLTTYNRLKTTLYVLQHATATIDELKRYVAVLENSNKLLTETTEHLTNTNQKLTQLNDEREELKFKLTSKLIANYVEQHPHAPVDKGGESAEPQARMAQLQAALKADALPYAVLATIDSIPETHDNIYKRALRLFYEQRIAGVTPDFWDVRMALNALSRILQPRYYLEIGTRVGWSLSQVLAQSPNTQVYSFDMWIEQYGGVENPGQEFVHKMMSRITAPVIPKISFISGNSHNTLPAFFHPERFPSAIQTADRPAEFDLITVDGDHNLEGAWMDLMAVMPHIAIGGAIVFDDIELSLSNSDIGVDSETAYPDYYPPMPEGLQSLGDVWNAIKREFPNFTYLDGGDHPVSVGVGIRLS